MNGLDFGESGGLIGWGVAAAVATAQGIAWLLNWHGARENDRAARLQTWEASLVSRERIYREEIETRLRETETELGRVEGELATLRSLLAQLAIALRNHDPTNAVLDAAERILRRGSQP
jgi:hypothetical protein